MNIECGDYYDNRSVFLQARRHIQAGRVPEGYKMMHQLRKNILETKEVKSEKWILPDLEIELREIILS